MRNNQEIIEGSRPFLRVSFRSIRPWIKPKIIVGGVFVFLLCFMGVFAPILAPFDPNAQDLLKTLQPPGWWGGEHFLGTDHVGRDILSRIFFGATISLVTAITVVLISGLVGLALGAISGYFAGLSDFIIQKLVEVVWAFPPLLLAIAVVAFFGQGLGILIVAL